MAPAGDPSLTETPEYRIVVLFVGFVAITYTFEKFTGWMNHYLKKRNRHGLLHTIHKLEEELLALGLISLILVAVEDYIVKICVDSDDDGKAAKKKLAGGKKKTEEDKGKAPSDDLSEDASEVLDAEFSAPTLADDPLGTSEFEDEEVTTDATLVDDLGGNRKLLVGAMRMLLAGGGGGSGCPEGEESFWSIRTLHETHIFIFLLAVVHIVFSGLSMVLCSWKVRQWKQWEVSRREKLKKIEYNSLLTTNNCFLHYVRAFFAQFHQHIDESVYLSLRRLFIERMELDHDFEFHSFLVNFMEEEFSKVIKLEWVMWLVAAIWIATNPAVVLIMTGLGIAVTLLAGTKLESIALKLGNQAYIMYADKPPPGAKKGNVFVRSLNRISTGITQKLKGISSNNGQLRPNTELPKRVFQADGVDPSQIFDTTSTDLGRKSQSAAGVGSALNNLNQSRISAESGIGHDSVLSVGQGLGQEIGNPVHNYGDFPMPPMRRGAMNGYDPLYSRSMELHPAARSGQVGGSHLFLTDSMDDGSAGCACCCGWYCWKDTQYTEELRRLRKKTFSDSYLVQDSASLFPFRRPRLMLLIFQYTYFETSLMMAVLIFNLWQDVNPDLILTYTWVAFVEVVAGILVMVLTSILLLPVYWLTMVVGSHCPGSVLKKAKKKKVKAARALEKVSMSLKRTSVNIARTSMNLNKRSLGLQRTSMTSVETHSTISEEAPKSELPTHWADIKGTPEIIQAELKVQELEEDEQQTQGQTGALGMLVGAMLKNKKRELENLVKGDGKGDESGTSDRDLGSGETSDATQGGKKSMPLLRRLSVPLLNLPGIKEGTGQESQTEEAKVVEPEPHLPVKPVPNPHRASSSGVTKSALARTKSLQQEHTPLPELHDIQEVVTPEGKQVKGPFESQASAAGSMMRKSKSLQQLCQDDAPEAQTLESSSGTTPPSLSRASMPMMKIIGKKQKAYLERERRNAEHMMMEHPEDVGRGKGSGNVADVVRYHGKSAIDKDGAKSPPERAVSSPPSDAERSGGSSRSGVSRSTLDHVAELVKLGDKEKHQRE